MKLKKLEAWIEKNQRLVLAVILGCNLALCLALFDPKPNCGGDNAEYIVLAESIFRLGDGYSLSYEPEGAGKHVRLPFGYPLLLAPLSVIFGRNLLVFKLLSLLFEIGSVALFFLLARQFFTPLPATALTLAVAFNPEIVDFSHWILTETPFLFFSLLSLLLFLKSEKMESIKTGRWFWLALACIAFTAHIRTVGMALAAAGWLFYALHRKWKKLLLFSLCMAALLSPWLVHSTLATQKGYFRAILARDHYKPELGNVSIGEMAARMLANAGEYSTRTTAATILSFDFIQEGKTPGAVLISVTATALILLGLFTNLFPRPGILELYAPAYIAIIAVQPLLFIDVRYFVPVIPLMLIYMAQGAAAAARLAKRKLPDLFNPAAAVAILVALSGLAVQAARIPDNLRMMQAYLKGDRYAGYLDSWRNLFLAADWARKNTPQSSVFTVRKPSLFHLFSGRKATLFPFSDDPDSVFAEIEKTDYVVIGLIRAYNQLLVLHKTTDSYLVPAMEKHPERFKLLFRTSTPTVLVWEVVKTDQGEPSDSAPGQQPDKAQMVKAFRQLFGNDTTDLKLTIEYYKKVLKKDKFNYEALKNLAYLYWQFNNLEESAKYYEFGVQANPDDEFMLHYAGKINDLLQRYETSKIYYNKLLDKNPQHLATLVNMGKIERIEGNLQKAEEYYLRALAVDSTDASANNNYANLLVMTGRMEQAKIHYKKVLEKEPYDSQTHRVLAMLYLRDPAHYEESLYHFRILCRLLPQEANEIEEKYIKRIQAMRSRSARIK